MATHAQFNTDRLITIGRSALYYEDYVLSIQYFNQAIAAKPYLYEPWFFRGVAKYYLDDFAGAENDCTSAIERNPYVTDCYELRGLCRIQQNRYEEAAADYTTALKYNPENMGLWHNRVLCYIRSKDYDRALAQLDTMNVHWPRQAAPYSMRAEVYMQQKDTIRALEAIEKSIEIDPYDGQLWAARAIISLSRSEWEQSEDFLDKAIHLLPKNGGNYINRALARYNRNNLRGAMADYDTALDLEPNNFLGHYNRGLLRAQVGDDNRGIEDFDFVLNLEPDNMLALFNRAVLLERTGDLQGAVRDYSRVIDEYPEFHTGILYRARCYRRMGQTQKAELDEFKVYKSQLYQHLYGIEPDHARRSQRKRSDIDPDKYDELVVADEEQPEREYKTEYRGHVQNRRADTALLPMFALTLEARNAEVNGMPWFDPLVDDFNSGHLTRTLFINNRHTSLDTPSYNSYLEYTDSLTTAIRKGRGAALSTSLLIARAAAYSVLQDYDAAIADLDACLETDSTSVLALWQRAVCRQSLAQLATAEGKPIQLASIGVLADIDRALRHGANAYLLYNRAFVHAQREEFEDAVADLDAALAADPRLAEAWFNRGICHLRMERHAEAVSDLSKAGELGIFQAYSIIKKYGKF